MPTMSGKLLLLSPFPSPFKVIAQHQYQVKISNSIKSQAICINLSSLVLLATIDIPFSFIFSSRSLSSLTDLGFIVPINSPKPLAARVGGIKVDVSTDERDLSNTSKSI